MSGTNFSVPNMLGGGDMLSNVLNSKLATTMYQAMANQQRESRGVPDSTRRAFVSGMEADARIARQGAQNMGDAAGMLTVAQTGVTTIKYNLTEMRKLLTELEADTGASDETKEGYAKRLNDYLEHIMDVASSTEFNGYNLLDGSTPVFELQAGNMQTDADMPNMLDKIKSALGEPDPLLGTGPFELADIDTKAARDDLYELLTQLVDFSTNVEASLANDIKGVTNLGVLLESQADIHDSVRENHMIGGDDENTDGGGGGGEGDTPSSASYLDALMQGSIGTGNIFSGTS